MKFYGSMICADTVYADKVLRSNNIDVEYIDITANIANMKEFIRLRDSRKEFDSEKENGYVGIPAFLKEDGSIEFDVFNLEGVKKKEKEQDSEGICSI